MKRTLLATAAAATLSAASAFAQLSLTVPGVSVVEDFANFNGSGFAPAPAVGQLDSDAWSVQGLSDGDLAFGGTETTGDFARGTSAGSVTTGGIYAFDVGGGNRALGVQPTGTDFEPGAFTLRAQNQTGVNLDAFELGFSLYTYNDQARASSWDFSYSWNNVDFTDVPTFDLTSPTTADASPAWIAIAFSEAFALTWTSDAYLYLRWSSDNASASGSRDQFALDDVSILGTISTAPPTLAPVPEPSTYGLLAGLALAILIARRRFAR